MTWICSWLVTLNKYWLDFCSLFSLLNTDQMPNLTSTPRQWDGNRALLLLYVVCGKNPDDDEKHENYWMCGRKRREIEGGKVGAVKKKNIFMISSQFILVSFLWTFSRTLAARINLSKFKSHIHVRQWELRQQVQGIVVDGGKESNHSVLILSQSFKHSMWILHRRETSCINPQVQCLEGISL